MTAQLPRDSRDAKPAGKPYAGNPHVRFEEGGQEWATPYLASTLLVDLASRLPGPRFELEPAHGNQGLFIHTLLRGGDE